MPPSSCASVLPLWLALVPILSVGIVPLLMCWVVLLRMDTCHLALQLFGATGLARVGRLWPVITALTVALMFSLTLSRPPPLMETLNAGPNLRCCPCSIQPPLSASTRPVPPR